MWSPKQSQVATCAPDGVSDLRYLGALGHVGGLTYGYMVPGGCDNLTCTLMQPPLQRYTALNPGRVVRVYRGMSVVWEGKLNEPVESSNGWQLQAYGSGHYGDDFMSYHTNYGQKGDPVIKAIAGTPGNGRGKLRWVAPENWSDDLYLLQPPDSASVPITDYMNNVTGPHNLVWYVGRGNVLRVFEPPTTPPYKVTRLLVVPDPVARTLAGYFTWLWIRYCSKAQNTKSASGGAAQFSLTSVANERQQDRHGPKETYADLSSVGQLSNAAAEDIGTDIMGKYQAANYAGPFTVTPGQLLNTGGTAVDLGCEQAGEIVQLVLGSGGYGGDVNPAPPVQFMSGGWEYNDETETGTLTPWLGVASDLATLLSNYTTTHQPKTKQSSWAIKYRP